MRHARAILRGHFVFQGKGDTEMGIYGFDSGTMGNGKEPLELDITKEDFFDKVLPMVDELTRRAWGREQPYVKTGYEDAPEIT